MLNADKLIESLEKRESEEVITISPEMLNDLIESGILDGKPNKNNVFHISNNPRASS